MDVLRAACLVVPLALVACSEDGPGAMRAQALMEETCIGCHDRLNPGLVADHFASPHSLMDDPIECEICHGGDHNKIFRVDGAVPPTVCKTCHEQECEDFWRSTHGRRLKGGALDTLLADATPATGGCMATTGCHSIQKVYEDDSVGRCSTCHVSHAFRNEQARNPRVCIGCHGGVDHPQYEAWMRSSHSLPSPSGDGLIADCLACHDPHDVSCGITHGLPPVPYQPPVTVIEPTEPEKFEAARAAMMERCTKCHSVRVARTALEQADLWRHRGAVMLERAFRVVSDLHRDGLLDLPPEARVANPLAGHGLRLGGKQIFDAEVSLPERIYYEMYFHHYPALWRAVYHTDPERVSWHANDALKSALDRILAADRELRRESLVAEESQR
jgi:hypothetical protein